MKKLIFLFALPFLFSCTASKTEEPAVRKKVICGDSMEVEMFDEQGNSYFTKIPGTCDTVEVKEGEQVNE